MGSSIQDSSGMHWCGRRVRFNEVPKMFRIKFNRDPRKFRRRIREALVQRQVKFNRVPEKVPEKIPGSLRTQILCKVHWFLYCCYRLLLLATVTSDNLLSSANYLNILQPVDFSILTCLKPEHILTLTSFNPKYPSNSFNPRYL